MIAVCSIEAGTATEWQAALLSYSMRRAGVSERLTVLSAGGPPTQPIDAQIVVTPNFSALDGLPRYSPLNKPCSLAHWLGEQPTSDTILILDPDMVVIDDFPPLHLTPREGEAIGQQWPDLVDLHDTWIRALTPHPDLLQPLGVPIWVGGETLAEVAPLWADRTQAVRQAAAIHDTWVTEMYGFLLATSTLGIHLEGVQVDCGPILHYGTYHCPLGGFDKRRYKPWNLVPVPSTDGPAAALAHLINEYAALQAQHWY